MSIKSASIIMNLRSGGLLGEQGRSAARKLERMCRDADLDADIHTVHPRKLAAAVRKAANNGADAVVVAGGDGTIRTAAKILAFKPKPLGILPLGTRNRLSRALGIPDDPAEAIRALVSGTVRNVDIGEVNGQVFVFTSMFGIINRFGRHREEHRGRSLILEFPAAALAVLNELLRLPSREMEIVSDGKTVQCRTSLFAVTNNPFVSGGLGGQPRLESLDSGMLGFYMSCHPGRLGLLKLVGELMTGRWEGDPQVDRRVTPELTIRVRGDKPVEIMNDGEFLTLESPLYYRTRPGALRMLVPAEKEKVLESIAAGADAAHAKPAEGGPQPA